MESMHSIQSESNRSQIGAGVGGFEMTTKSKAELWREVKILSMFFTLFIPFVNNLNILSLYTDTDYPILYNSSFSFDTYSA